MTAKLDALLFHYAGWWIRIAAFFGISRWQLIVGWIWVMTTITYCPTSVSRLIELPLALAVGLAMGIPAVLLLVLDQAKGCYREDEVLSDNCLIRHQSFRVGYLVFWVSLGFFSGFHNMALVGAKLTLPLYLWVYFCLHQSPKDPVTLKKLVKSLATKVRRALTPTPQPRLAPQPITFSAPLP